MLLKMLVGAIKFGKAYFSWTVNIPLTYHRNALFLPKHTMAVPKAVPQTVFPLQLNKKKVLEIQKKLPRCGWFPPPSTNLTNSDYLPQQALGALQTNRVILS